MRVLLIGLMLCLAMPFWAQAQEPEQKHGHQELLNKELRGVERLEILYALRKQEVISEEAFASIARFIATTDDPGMQGEAIAVVRKHVEDEGAALTLEPIRNVAQTAEWYPRRHAILALSAIDGPSDKSREVFLANIKNDHPAVRAAAVQALSENPQPMEETVALLVQALDDEDGDPRHKASSALHDLSRSAASHYLVQKHWKDIAPHVRDEKSEMVQGDVLHMIRQLLRKKYTLNEGELLAAVKHGLSSEHTYVLKATMYLIQDVGDALSAELIPEVEKLTTHESPILSHQAEEALKILRKKSD